jgi:medium-chain acyl-[acyl-carrier-protein] hydrolase
VNATPGSGDTIAHTPTLLRFGTTGSARRRIFCLPFAGGTPAAYRLWTRDLPDDVEVVAVPLPGRNPASREPLLDSMDDIVTALLPAIRGAADLPFVIFGHSLGALVAFELTIALERSDTPSPAALFVSGRRSPDAPATSRPIYDLPDDAFLDAIDRSFGGVPEAIRREPELLALLLPALRADVRTYETYAPLTDRKVRCPVHVYGGADDAHPRPDELSGWQRVAEQPVTVQLFAGGHFYLTSARTDLTADIIRRWTRTPSRTSAP